MRTYKIIDGDEKAPVGAMTDTRWKTFSDMAVAQRVYPKTLDPKKAYTLAFVPK